MIGERRIGGYTLFYDFDALCEAEKLVGPMGAAMALLEQGSLTTIRALAWAGLRRHHAEITPEKTGEIIIKVGFHPLAEAIGEAMKEVFPDDSGEEKPAGKPKGRKKQTG
ncbi:hypothetical protein D6851_02590 [Altericroceibacterium spongiae]|uniref:Gene transfer agent family protein n=1 Tax=Altericroceibacterium spongiae TaxID=2320269 RepID=A0A420ERS4_9SPHN|nr:hypothetical protein [Altericroceibacterium spongiae]RKF23378.1 hypothetical protein D6851_02590 [Altericroceibacterium spongiae]